jgi:hypothetical protein
MDFPLGMRVATVVIVILAICNGIVFLAGAVAIVGLLSAAGAHPAAWGVVGTIVGALISAGVGSWTAREIYRRQHEKEARDLAVSLHAELADRAARCVSDYLVPWKQIVAMAGRKKKITPAWIAKFRPADPVAYPGVAAKIGLLPAQAIFPVLQFYFRLDALRREIDAVTADFGPNDEIHRINPGRVVIVARRLQSCIGPALTALDRLNVDTWKAVEHEAASTYPHLRDSGKSLRKALKDERIK